MYSNRATAFSPLYCCRGTKHNWISHYPPPAVNINIKVSSSVSNSSAGLHREVGCYRALLYLSVLSLTSVTRTHRCIEYLGVQTPQDRWYPWCLCLPLHEFIHKRGSLFNVGKPWCKISLCSFQQRNLVAWSLLYCSSEGTRKTAF